MGTHGLYGYILNGIYYLMYVHYDGDMLMSVMKREAYVLLKHYGTIASVKNALTQVKWIYGDLVPTKAVMEHLKPWTNLSVDFQSTKSWYCLLYHCQKSLIHTLNAGFGLTYNKKAPSDQRPNYGLMCWWNLDTNMVEFYNDDELLNSYNVDDLIANPPSNFPRKTFDEISIHYMNNYNQEQNRLVELSDQLKQISESNNLSAFNISSETNNQSMIYNHDYYDDIIQDEDMEEKLKLIRIIDRLKFNISELKERAGSRYINLLWKDLGVIHYENLEPEQTEPEQTDQTKQLAEQVIG